MLNWENITTDISNDYELVINNLQKEIDLSPTLPNNYYYLGLAHLLKKQEDKAQTTWALGRANSSTPSLFTEDIVKILKQESNRQEQLKNYQVAFDLRQAIHKFLPDDFENIVQIFYLSLYLSLITSETLRDLNIENVLESSFVKNDKENKNLLLQLLQNVLSSPLSEEEKVKFVVFCLPYIDNKEESINLILCFVQNFSLDVALQLLDISQKACPNHLGAFALYIDVLVHNELHDRAIQDAKIFLLANQSDLLNKVVANHLLLGSIMGSGGKWEDAELLFNDHQSLMLEVIEKGFTNIPPVPLSFIQMSSFFATYFYDTPYQNRLLQNPISRLFQDNIQLFNSTSTKNFRDRQLVRKQVLKSQTKVYSPSKKLKIGFLSTSLRQHSVGWLARFLIQYLDRDTFELYGYFPGYSGRGDFLEEWFLGTMHKVFRAGREYWGDNYLVANEIDRDQIDILIDLESLTSGVCCQIMALKPAPIQVTWLGWDASGIPAVDYYIADPYVLPDDAQEYYTEKIWRMPQTYIAVDGFEANVANLSRDRLNIPSDAIVYFSSQVSRKRHPEIVKLQMQILKHVPNSYFLIKGLSDQLAIKEFFYEMAELEGVNCDILRFLPFMKDEGEHRGNLSLADVVLDTYPYNGATTTMEVLWMGIPLVTRVGEQFVARNSYTMMTNVGITEGIAWTPEEYVRWGVRFGTEPDLRKEVAWKLRKSRKTSPLWNTRQLTKEMEKAFIQMWEIYNG